MRGEVDELMAECDRAPSRLVVVLAFATACGIRCTAASETARCARYIQDTGHPGGLVSENTSEHIEAVLFAKGHERWNQKFEDKRRAFTEDFLLCGTGDAAARVLREIGVSDQL